MPVVMLEAVADGFRPDVSRPGSVEGVSRLGLLTSCTVRGRVRRARLRCMGVSRARTRPGGLSWPWNSACASTSRPASLETLLVPAVRRHVSRVWRVLAVLLTAALVDPTESFAAAAPAAAAALETAQELFYNGQYEEAATLTRSVAPEHVDLAVMELRTSAVLFQIRRAMGDGADKERALKACETCAALIRDFKAEFTSGRAMARDAVALHPKDATALFYLGKLNLNYVWLELGTLGHRTGWNEYWEARHSLDESLALAPSYRRARVARAWIDYIVDTRMPWGTGWLLGGGNKKKALRVMHDAATSGDDRYAYAEALFGLWDMQIREKRTADALESARRLAGMFPNNAEVARFVASGTRTTHD